METKQFESGAVRSKDADNVRYDLISPIGLRRLAETYAEGAAKYGPYNWQKGIPASELSNHALRHIYLWLSGDKSEDHMGHAIWNLITLAHFEETRPDLMDISGLIEKAEDKFTFISRFNSEVTFSKDQLKQWVDNGSSGILFTFKDGATYYLRSEDTERFKKWYGVKE